MPEHQYDAFISYRRSDGRSTARWLRRELEAFRAPKALRATFGRKLSIYLDTAYERGTIDFYEQSIKPALLASRYLLLVATPDAMPRPGRGDDWIEREIDDFIAGPNGHNIIAVRGAGEFDGPLPGNLKQRFPNIEIVDLRAASRFWYLNPVRAARLSAEKLKIIAPLLDLPAAEMPRLRQEEEKRQQNQLGGTIGATMGVLVAVTGLSVFALQSRNQAVRALEDSMFAAGGMALQASGLPSMDGSTGRVRRHIINRGCDLVDKFGRGAVSDPPVTEMVMCRLERARELERLHEDAEARKRFTEAIEIAAKRHQQLSRIDAAVGIVDARQGFGEYLVRQKDAGGAELQFEQLLEDARRLAGVHDGRAEFVRPQGEALGQLGDIYAARGERRRAAESYETAAVAVGKTIELKSEVSSGARTASPENLAWLARLHRLAGQQYLELDEADPAIERFGLTLGVRALAAPDGVLPEVEQEIALALALTSEIEQKRNHAAAAGKAKAEALASIGRIAGARHASSDLKRWAASLKQFIETGKTGDETKAETKRE